MSKASHHRQGCARQPCFQPRDVIMIAFPKCVFDHPCYFFRQTRACFLRLSCITRCFLHTRPVDVVPRFPFVAFNRYPKAYVSSLRSPFSEQFPPSPEPPWCRNPSDGKHRQETTAAPVSYADFLHEQFADEEGKDNRQMKDARDYREVRAE